MGSEEREIKRREFKAKIKQELESLESLHKEIQAKAGSGKELAAQLSAALELAAKTKSEMDANVLATTKAVTGAQAQLELSKIQVGEVAALKQNAQTNFSQLQQLNTTAAQSKTDIAAAVAILTDKAASLDKAKAEFSKWEGEVLTFWDDYKKTNEKEFKQLYQKIDGLLAGATSVGLAKSFGDRRLSYKWPRIIWASVGVGALIAIVFLAILQGANILTVDTWSQFGLIITRKLPVILPLIWIAYYGFHQFGILSRIEEEYAHKESLSKAFEGYKGQLKEPVDAETEKGLEKLIAQTLEALAKQPAEAYDTKTKPVMPSDEALSALKTVVERLSQVPPNSESRLPDSPKWAIVGSSVATAVILLLLSIAAKVFIGTQAPFGVPAAQQTVSSNK